MSWGSVLTRQGCRFKPSWCDWAISSSEPVFENWWVQLFWMNWLPKTLFYLGNAYRVNLDLLFCEKVDLVPSTNLDHGNKGGILMAIQPRFWQLRAPWKVQYPLLWIRKAAPGRQEYSHPEQHRLASPTSILLRMWAKLSHYNMN